MTFATGTICSSCATMISDSDVTNHAALVCTSCDPVLHFHSACAGPALICPMCLGGVAVADFDEWGPKPVVDGSQWADEDPPNQQVPNSWEDIADWPQGGAGWWNALYAFLQAPPAAGEWVYDGYKHGGHEFYWHGESSAVFGPGALDIRFHVHFTGKSGFDGGPGWTYGSAWVTDVKNVEVNIEENNALHNPLLPVVHHHWQTMLEVEAAMKEKKDAEQGSWRK